jgi:predicted negative regulator of RcsB-dependent stress response
VATHYDDEAQVDALKKWWKENWLALAAGLGIGLGAIFGWEGYQSLRDGRAEGAAQLFGDFQGAVARDDAEAAGQLAETLTREFADSPYAILAQLKIAEQAVRAKAFDRAQRALQWVVEEGKDANLQAIAALRLARVEFQQGALDAALARITTAPEGFEALYAELRGDLRLAQGDREAALAAYSEALAALDAAAPNRPLLQQKIDDLAAAVRS